MAKLPEVFGDGVGVSRWNVLRRRRTDAAATIFNLASQHKLSLVDFGKDARFQFGKLPGISQKAPRVEMLQFAQQ